MRLDYRGGVLGLVGIIVAKYVEDILPPLGSIIKYLLVDSMDITWLDGDWYCSL